MKIDKMVTMISDHYDIDVNEIVLLREGGSNTYCVHSPNDSYILKLIPPSFRKTVKESLNILKYLEEEKFPSPQVMQTKTGLLSFEMDDKLGVLFRYVKGQEHSTGEDFEIIGALVGRLHQLMKAYQGTLKVHDKAFFIDRYINLLKEKKYDCKKIEQFQEYGDLLWDKVKDLPRGYCHGDLHTGNLLKISTGNYHLLDFDTSCEAFPIYDIMVICNRTDYFKYDEDGYQRSKETYETFLKGYLKYCQLSKMELDAFYDLVAVYHYQLQATIIEIYGLDCIDDQFIDNQLDWLMKWRQQCESK